MVIIRGLDEGLNVGMGRRLEESVLVGDGHGVGQFQLCVCEQDQRCTVQSLSAC